MTVFESEKQKFLSDGFVVVPQLFTPEEVSLLSEVARMDQKLSESAYGREDGTGAVVTLAVRNELTDDYYSAIARSNRIVSRMNEFLGDEVYHYHHKLILKEPRVGGAWEWHQDYGYWYNNGCLLPDMGSCLIAIDDATVENGCLQVLRGSHRIGRIDHGPIGDQTGADLERVAVAKERFETVPVELKAGSAVFFHANLLHRSDRNTSENPRWALICCFNTKSNDPYKTSRHPNYSPIDVLADDEVRSRGEAHRTRLQPTAG
ncbi:Phytanoyl-CoA dioxygenase (PhyH) [Thalassoglobus neptunius]|uniref:Phytanoyl-CoA dioxygenase (PhyH) n=1 Tax=Thalassoglobus neptunius TaxID=1938619 RepID=A0A5C5X1Y7_9PLAN|nr:phytanoyl-CoA dioxygenase family protein [Thalassoglobus neptunius]TWT56936.1 Phytanoyl-CoA dioxygenase (PhyH) [Thalassoglobus neptunius]